MPTTFFQHTGMALRRAFREFKIGRDMGIGASIAVLTLGLQVWWRLIPLKDWEEHKWQWVISVAGPFIVVFGGHALWRLITSPWRVHQDQEKEIDELRGFRRRAEDAVIHLLFARSEVKMVPFGEINHRQTFCALDHAECIYLVFANPKKPGIPGKIARSVLARVKYTELESGRSFEQEGRWARNDQPALLRPGQSTNSIVRTDFNVGDEHPLDIAAKFQDGCYGVNNEGIKRTDNVLREDVAVTVHLVSENVDQTFKFELRNIRSAAMMKIIPA